MDALFFMVTILLLTSFDNHSLSSFITFEKATTRLASPATPSGAGRHGGRGPRVRMRHTLRTPVMTRLSPRLRWSATARDGTRCETISTSTCVY